MRLCVGGHAGAELHARLAVPEEVEDHRTGLHLLAACREHEEEESDRLQYGGGWDRVRPPALHPGQLLPQAAPHGRQLQETTHQPRWCQQYIPQQVTINPVNKQTNKHVTFKVIKKKARRIWLHLIWYSSETIMFLHEIFHQGLKARIANWPTLVLGEWNHGKGQLCLLVQFSVLSISVMIWSGWGTNKTFRNQTKPEVLKKCN